MGRKNGNFKRISCGLLVSFPKIANKQRIVSDTVPGRGMSGDEGL